MTMEANPMAVVVDGVQWRPFTIEFETQEGAFHTQIYAVNWEHAVERLEELKQTAFIMGEVYGCETQN
jgi:hypothetical protein